MIIFKLIVMIVEIQFILHVANGIYIILHELCYSIVTRIRIRIFSYSFENITIE